jgi:hypothetical protein
VAAHPGVAATEGQRQDTSLQGKILAGGSAQSPEMGALAILYAATTPGVGGTSRDTALATQIWERSELLTGVHYAIESLAR